MGHFIIQTVDAAGTADSVAIDLAEDRDAIAQALGGLADLCREDILKGRTGRASVSVQNETGSVVCCASLSLAIFVSTASGSANEH